MNEVQRPAVKKGSEPWSRDSIVRCKNLPGHTEAATHSPSPSHFPPAAPASTCNEVTNNKHEIPTNSRMHVRQDRLEKRRPIFETIMIGLPPKRCTEESTFRVLCSVFYGDSGGWLKCPKVQCFAFSEGFPKPCASTNLLNKLQSLAKSASPPFA